MSNIFLMSAGEERRKPIRFRIEQDRANPLTFHGMPRDAGKVAASLLNSMFMRMKRGVSGNISLHEAKKEIAVILAAAFKQTDVYAWLRDVGPDQVQFGGGITHSPGSLPSAAISIAFKDRRLAERFEANFIP